MFECNLEATSSPDKGSINVAFSVRCQNTDCHAPAKVPIRVSVLDRTHELVPIEFVAGRHQIFECNDRSFRIVIEKRIGSTHETIHP